MDASLLLPGDGVPQRILLGDSRRLVSLLPDRCVHLLLTDPPYGTRVNRDGYGRRAKHKGRQHIAGDEDLVVLDELMGEAWKTLRQDAWVILFCSPKRHFELGGLLRDWGLTLRHEVVWDKQMMGLGSGVRYQHELVLLCSFGKAQVRSSQALPSVWRESVPRTGLWHPHQKPLGLVGKLIEYGTDPGEFVLDPFCGSGTVALACRKLWRHCLAIEVDERHHAAACRRFEGGDAAGGRGLFDGEVPAT